MNLIHRLADLETVSLSSGAHESRDHGLCVMEAVAYVAGEAHADDPQCVCPVIGAFLRGWNDGLRSDAERDRLLKPLILRVLNSRSTPEVEEQRAYLATDWLVRVFAPAFLRMRPDLDDHAVRLAGLAPLRDEASALAARRDIAAARDAGAAAWDAAGDAARAAARDAARAAAWDAAWDAARDAARDAAGAAAWDAARDAARDALAPTVERLQQSALDLVERMIKVEAATQCHLCHTTPRDPVRNVTPVLHPCAKCERLVCEGCAEVEGEPGGNVAVCRECGEGAA